MAYMIKNEFKEMNYIHMGITTKNSINPADL